MYADELKAYLEANPTLEAAYINENGEWLFHERKGFRKVLRDEILGKIVGAVIEKIIDPVADKVVDLVEDLADEITCVKLHRNQ
jgi:hypothetical protein